MLYELRMTRLRPAGAADYEKRLQAALATETGLGTLCGCFHVEIGPLNRVVELWAYADEGEHAAATAARASRSASLTVDGEAVLAVEAELLRPAPFMRRLDGTPLRLGPIYELRAYRVRSGQLPRMIELWGQKLAERERLSPLAGVWHSEAGGWFHLWPYPDLLARSQIREEAVRQGIWPPPTTDLLYYQENLIMLPAPFSPLQ
jgi:hypothetical protein